MGEHSILPPSSASIWGKPDGCTGWYQMQKHYPDVGETIEAAEGTASHEIGSTLINHFINNDEWLTSRYFISAKASNGIEFTEEMFDAALIYAQNVVGVYHRNYSDCHIEERIEINDIHSVVFGTPDCWVVNPHQFRLYIWDYKFGHEIVEAFENWQLLCYLAGIIKRLKIDDSRLTVHMRIIQPRAYHIDGIIREWEINAALLRPYFNILHNNAHAALSNNAKTKSGSHCRHCTARHACMSAIHAGVQLYEIAGQPIPYDMPLDALGLQCQIVERARKQLEYIETGMKAQIESMVKSGKIIPGWKLQRGRSSEKWNDKNQVALLGDLLEIDLRKPQDVITVKQARDKGVSDDVLRQFSEKTKTRMVLVQDNGTKLKRIFSNLGVIKNG